MTDKRAKAGKLASDWDWNWEIGSLSQAVNCFVAASRETREAQEG